MRSGGRRDMCVCFMLRNWPAFAMLITLVPATASGSPLGRCDGQMPLAFASAVPGLPAPLQRQTQKKSVTDHTLAWLHRPRDVKTSRIASSFRENSFSFPACLPVVADQLHCRQLSQACESSASHSGDGWQANQNVEVDVLEEDIEAGEDMVSTVRESAYALLVAALNPESDPSWDEEIELSIVLCSDGHIQSLNRQWRGKDAPTDVLSFVQDSSDTGSDGILGDLVISIPTAERQAKERNHSVLAELRILMVHGLLHLLGYDHEESQEELEEMADAEQRLLRRLGWEGDGLIVSAS